MPSSQARSFALILAGVGSFACSDSSEVALRGSVQKGPFVVGSSISLSLLDDRLSPNGSVFQTQTINDRGEFGISFPASGPVSLEGQGFYFNEVAGSLSLAPLTLRAFYAPGQTGTQQVFVNMVTHLTAERIKTLVGAGSSFAAAVQEAENELRLQLNITATGYVPSVGGVSMDITGGNTSDNAYLLGVSSVLIQAALMHASGSLDAALQELLNAYTFDLADDGMLEQERRDGIAAALRQLQVDAVQSNLARRLAELGSTDSVPDMRQVMDQERCCQQGTAYAACRYADGMPTCNAGLACAVGLDCAGGDACCLPAGGLGQPCGEAPDPTCADPDVCSIVSVCDAGLACQPGSDGAPGTFVCLPGGGLGQACLPGQTCDPGLTCRSGVRLNGQSSAACIYGECCEIPNGSACSPSEPCPEGSACVAGFCDASCDGLECPVGSNCHLTSDDSRQPVAVCSPVGCDEDSDCPAGSVCDGVACKPPGSSTGTGTGGLGERCSVGSLCDTPLLCAPAPADLCGAPLCCQLVSYGSENQPCLPGNVCNEGLECQSDGPGGTRCVEVPSRGGLGEACIGDSAVEEVSCNPGLLCNFGTVCSPYDLNECCLPEASDAGAPDAG